MKFILAAAMAVLFATGAFAGHGGNHQGGPGGGEDCGCGDWSGNGGSASSGWSKGGAGGETGYDTHQSGFTWALAGGGQSSSAGSNSWANINGGNEHSYQSSGGWAGMIGYSTGSGESGGGTDWSGASSSWADFHYNN